MNEPQTNGTNSEATIPIPQPQVTQATPAPPIVRSEPVPQARAPQQASDAEETDHVPMKGNNLIMPREALNKRLASAVAKGKREAMEEFDAQAKAGGFASVQDMFRFVGKMAQQQQAQPGKPAKAQQQTLPEGEVEAPKVQQANSSRWERKLEHERRKAEAERRTRLKEERRRKELEQVVNEKEAEMVLRQEAVRAGVTDVDYVVSLIRRDLEGKPVEELKGFDESKYFESLRQTRPHLFNEVIRPANTGNGSGNHPTPPNPASVAGQGNGQAPGVRKMSAKDYQDYLRKRGIQPT